MNRPAFVFDFDGVIADTARLKDLIFSSVEQVGFSRPIVEAVYESVKRDRGGQDPAEFARRLSDGDQRIETAVTQAWKEGEQRIVEVVSQPMLSCIREIRSSGYPTVLLTAGRVEVQARKVLHAGLSDTLHGPFGKIVYIEEDGTGDNKVAEIRTLLSSHPFLAVFDDQPYNIGPFAERFPRDRVLPVLVRLFRDQRNAGYAPPPGVPILAAASELNLAHLLSLLPAPWNRPVSS